MKRRNALTDVPGLRVGHAHDAEALTGCTVVLCEQGAVAGVDQRGGAPGTRETDALRPMHLVERVHGVLLTGGSAFGLDAATGVMRYLEDRGVGYDTGVARVPIVPAAVIFDLAVGRADVRPDAAMGYAACQAASDGPVAEGNVGAGMGATVGKILGLGRAMKSGLGTASVDAGGGVVVAALVVVNPLGDVVDPESGAILAGARNPDKGPLRFGEGPFADTLRVLRSLAGRTALRFAARGNTVVGVMATNARLTKSEANKVVQMAQDGVARTVRPAHTMFDGDTLFCLATGQKKADVNIVGAFAAEAVAQAILRAVMLAEGVDGLPSFRDLRTEGGTP
ncbi:MAG TPA: P1 family peptidase [Anaerolineae bacterium]|nr:P1 family peptidase [Anaerolineae bacterium]HID83905.1 peptidase S58 family protein [Anaerolineales bacterium]HIQ08834.1 peptidase S58 family protein [Anaerolineaceae bacterium]